jgi:hypothetical protein
MVVASQPPSIQRALQMAFFAEMQRLGWRVHRFLTLKNKNVVTENEVRVDGDVRTLILRIFRWRFQKLSREYK